MRTALLIVTLSAIIAYDVAMSSEVSWIMPSCDLLGAFMANRGG